MNYSELYQRGLFLARDFWTAKPFPHVVIPHFLPREDFLLAQAVFPQIDSDAWKAPENAHTHRKFVMKRGPCGIKEQLHSSSAQAVLREFNSASFLYFLEKLTGIRGLIGDPYFAEGGFHCTGNGGFLDVHADFSHHDDLGLERRLNLIYYLNNNWKPEYGGGLKLYDKDVKPVTEVMPEGNTALIFATSDTSFHGHPEPMNLPDGVYRKSIAMYYYTLPTERKVSKVLFPSDPHFVHTPSII